MATSSIIGRAGPPFLSCPERKSHEESVTLPLCDAPEKSETLTFGSCSRPTLSQNHERLRRNTAPNVYCCERSLGHIR
jgi:hypothetical protein